MTSTWALWCRDIANRRTAAKILLIAFQQAASALSGPIQPGDVFLRCSFSTLFRLCRWTREAAKVRVYNDTFAKKVRFLCFEKYITYTPRVRPKSLPYSEPSELYIPCIHRDIRHCMYRFLTFTAVPCIRGGEVPQHCYHWVRFLYKKDSQNGDITVAAEAGMHPYPRPEPRAEHNTFVRP